MTQDSAVAPRYAAAVDSLAAFAASTSFDALPEPVVAESKRCLLDFLGVAIGASGEPAVQHVLGVARELGGEPQATILADGSRSSVLNAALVNGIASHVFDFDDTHAPTILHGTGPIGAAAIAVGEWRARSGSDLIAAHALGFEFAARMALALFPDHYDVGWHMTGTAGTFGSAVAASRLMDLEGGSWRNLIGIAATQAAGHREQFGTMTKSLHAGKAASNGLLAALLAARGFTASESSVGGRRGMVSVMNGRPSQEAADELDGQLGDRWELARNGFKPYACGVVAHPGIDAVRQLVDRDGIDPREVETIELRVHARVIELTSKPTPRTGLEGKFSIAFASAVAMLDGAARERQFTDENVGRADVVELRDRISPVADATLTPAAATAIARLRDGREVRSEVQAATGTPANPMTDDELHIKFHDLVDGMIGQDAAGRLAEAIDRLETLTSLDVIGDAVRRRA